MKTITPFSSIKTALVLAGLGSLLNFNTHAATITWITTSSVNASWSTTANWSGGIAPGATSGTTNTDIALFNTAVGANGFGTTGTGKSPILIDTGRNIGGITFDTGAGNFVIGLTTNPPLLLTSGGSIQMTNLTGVQTEIVAAPLVIEGANGTYTFSDNATGTGQLIMQGAISGTGGGSTTLDLAGSQATTSPLAPGGAPSVNAISGAIGNGGATTMNLQKDGTSTWALTGSNTYSGTTTVNGGMLIIGTLTTVGNSATASLANVSAATGSINSTAGVTIGASGILALNMTNNAILGGPISDNGAIYGAEMYSTNVNTVSGNISGAGTFTQSGVGITSLTGSNSYTGTTLTMSGYLRANDGAGLSSSSLLNLDGGTLETNGNFTRSVGTTGGGAGANVEITGGTTGFSANGGTLTVSLGGVGTPSSLVWGSPTFNPGALVLNDAQATAAISFENNINLNAESGTVFVGANSANLDGAVSSTPGGGSLNKAGSGTLVLTNTNNTYGGGTFVGQGLLSVNANSSIGTGGAGVFTGGELRLNSTSNIASGQKIFVRQGGVLGVTDNGFNQATLAADLDARSNGIVGIDSTSYANALNMATLGNGSMYLGSSTTGVYGAGTLTIAPGGTDTVSAGLYQQFGNTYLLGGGGGTLILTGSNVLTDLASSYIATNPNNALGTSNTRNSLTVGSTGGDGAGTLDLANNQSFTGLTKINNGSTLVLDFSGAGVGAVPSSNQDILGEGNEVDLNQGDLTITGGSALSAATTGYSQTLADIGLRTGQDTISVNQGSDPLTVNLGVLGNGAANAGVSADIGSSTQIINTGNAATITTASAPGADGATLGGQVVYTANGTTTWAQATANSNGTYTLGAYHGDTNTLSTSASVAANPALDYVVSSNLTIGVSQTVNLLRLAGNTFTLNGSETNILTVGGGGILFTNAGLVALGGGSGANDGKGWLTSGAPANAYGYTFLNLQNYGTGGIQFGGGNKGATFTDPTATNVTSVNPTGAEHLVVVLGGTGSYSTPLLTTVNNYSGGVVLDGATLDITGDAGDGAFGTGSLAINGGTLVSNTTNGTGDHLDVAEFWNGSFTLGAVFLDTSSNNLDLSGLTGKITLTNNIAVTVNAGTLNSWSVSGPITDNGMGYGLTLNLMSGSIFAFGSTTIGDTFSGPLTVKNVGTNSESLVFAGADLTHNNVLYVGSGVGINLPGNSTFNLAGVNDAAGGNGGSTIFSNVGGKTETLAIWGSDSYSYAGGINNLGTSLMAIAMDGTGTQTLTGNNTLTGGITVNAGTLTIDASKGGAVGLNNLVLGGGTYDFKGATAGSTETLGSLTVNAGGSTLIVDNNGGAAGATALHLAALANNSGSMLDINETGSLATITTTSAVAVNTPYNSRMVYTDVNGNTTWVTGTTNTGLGTFTLGAYTGDTTALVASGGSATTNYMLSGSLGLTGTVAAGNLRITDTGSGSDVLDMAGKTLVLNNDGLLDNSTAAYSINDSVGGGVLTAGTATANKELDIWNFSKGGLTINSTIGNNGTTAIALSIGGPGKTTLTGSNTYGGLTTLNGGTVNFNKLANFGTGTAANGIAFGGGTLQYATGNTADLSNSGKTITFNAAGGGIDTNGNNITYAATTFGTGVGGLTVTDSTGTGVLNYKSNSGYTGNTIVQGGGHVNLSGSLAGGNNTIVGSGGLLTGGTTQQTSVAQTTSSNAGKLILQSGGVIAPGDTAGGLNITGRGVDVNDKGDQATGSTKPANNVLNATNLTWNAGGTLKFQLDNTVLPETFGPGFGQGPGTALDPSASTTLNLGTGSLVKVAGTGKFTLDFQNTGTWDMNFASNGTNGQNVYDLINFGVTNQFGVITPNTNFNIDDFSIVNLNGVGTLSFYFNANADGGLGQEELLLTVIPEPSTWAMLVGGLITLVFWTRRRRTTFAKSK